MFNLDHIDLANTNKSIPILRLFWLAVMANAADHFFVCFSQCQKENEKKYNFLFEF